MYKIQPLGELIDKVCWESFDCRDMAVKVDNIEFVDFDNVMISGVPRTMKRSAKSHIATRLGIPASYLDKCPPDLQRKNLSYWMQQEKNEELFVRFKGNAVRAFFTTKYRPVDNIDVAEKLRNLGYPDDTPARLRMNDEFMSLSIINPARDFDFRGSKMQCGVSIFNSEVGKSSLIVSAFINREICTNGAYITRILGRDSFRHISDKVLAGLEGLIDKAMGKLIGTVHERLERLAECPISDIVVTLDKLYERYHITEKQQTAVAWGWHQEGGNGTTMFAVFNAFTRAARHPELSLEDSHRLEEVSGLILTAA